MNSLERALFETIIVVIHSKKDLIYLIELIDLIKI